MSNFNVTVLGCGSATPTTRHVPSSQYVAYGREGFLVDCGEGAQLQLRRYGRSFARISHIFISHLHGDHFLGLPGLLATMALHDVGGTVVVHTFEEGIDTLRRMVNLVCRDRSFKLEYHAIDPHATTTVYENRHLRVTAFPLYHRVDAVGFRFDELPKPRHLIGEMMDFYDVPVYLRPALKEGADLVLPDGRVIENERLTTAPTAPMSYAYCSDTMYNEAVADAVRGVDTLYHESTYGDDGEYKAAPRGHSTARQAGRIAALAGVRRLVLGHYSQTVEDETVLAREAAEEFPGEVIPAREGLTLEL